MKPEAPSDSSNRAGVVHKAHKGVTKSSSKSYRAQLKPPKSGYSDYITANTILKMNHKRKRYAECGAAAALAVWLSGVDDHFPSNSKGTRGQLRYMVSSSKWKCLGVYDRYKNKVVAGKFTLQPGDILVKQGKKVSYDKNGQPKGIYKSSDNEEMAGHIFIYVGNSLVKKKFGENEKGPWFEASFGHHYPAIVSFKRKSGKQSYNAFVFRSTADSLSESSKYVDILSEEKKALMPDLTTDKKVKDQYVYDDYYISYHKVKGGSYAEPDITTYQYDSPTITIPDPIPVKGYQFTGWKDADGNAVSEIPTHSMKDFDLYATYKRETYTIAFNANGGSGAMKDRTIKVSQKTKLPANKFKRDGYAFVGWGTEESNNNTIYMNCDVIKDLAAPDKKATLYAQWVKTAEIKRYMVSFNANGGIGNMEPQVAVINNAVTLPKNTFSREGYVFDGWNTKADGSGKAYSNGDSLGSKQSGTLTLYAQWAQVVNEEQVHCLFNGEEFKEFTTAQHTYDINAKIPSKISFKKQDGTSWAKQFSISTLCNLDEETYQRTIVVKGENGEDYSFTWTWPIPQTSGQPAQ